MPTLHPGTHPSDGYTVVPTLGPDVCQDLEINSLGNVMFTCVWSTGIGSVFACRDLVFIVVLILFLSEKHQPGIPLP